MNKCQAELCLFFGGWVSCVRFLPSVQSKRHCLGISVKFSGFERGRWHILQPKCAVELQGSADEILRQDVLLLKHPLQVTRGYPQLHNPSSTPNTPVTLDELCCPRSFQLHTQGLHLG